MISFQSIYCKSPRYKKESLSGSIPALPSTPQSSSLPSRLIPELVHISFCSFLPVSPWIHYWCFRTGPVLNWWFRLVFPLLVAWLENDLKLSSWDWGHRFWEYWWFVLQYHFFIVFPFPVMLWLISTFFPFLELIGSIFLFSARFILRSWWSALTIVVIILPVVLVLLVHRLNYSG